MTTVYIDGDACPVRDEAYRVAARLAVSVIVVSNGSRPIRPPNQAGVSLVTVPATPDAADDWIAERIGAPDVCVTGDIPLAARCLDRGARAVAPNGKLWTADNIGLALAGRDIARHRRETGEATGGPPTLTRADRSRFLEILDSAVRAAQRGASGLPDRARLLAAARARRDD